MLLGRLCKLSKVICPKELIEERVFGLCSDSRFCQPGDIFFAHKGANYDGHDYVQDVIANRAAAAAVINQKEYSKVKYSLNNAQILRIIPATDVSQMQATMASNFYHHPYKKIKIIGVTGTNGKTTTTHMIRNILNAYNKYKDEHEPAIKAGLMGTVGYYFNDTFVRGDMTTPDSINTFRLLHRMRKKEITHLVMEVSSHAVALKRTELLPFSAMVFTNLTQDHLDFHKDMDEYFEAKTNAFRQMAEIGKEPKLSVIKSEEEYGDKLAKICAELDLNTIRYGSNQEDDYHSSDVALSFNGTKFNVHEGEESQEITLSAPGSFNVTNALAAIAVARQLKIPWDAIRDGLRNTVVAGRFQKIIAGDFMVVVDYAHTPDALLNIGQAILELNPQKLITVFGCGGDRDAEKRPIMGQIAADLSNKVYVTSDNPRFEDPKKIIEDILPGVEEAETPYEVIVDRKEAITKAIQEATGGTVVLIAGKGHEDYQILGSRTIKFDDCLVAKEAIRARGFMIE